MVGGEKKLLREFFQVGMSNFLTGVVRGTPPIPIFHIDPAQDYGSPQTIVAFSRPNTLKTS